jgi:hypothetical protein
MGPGQCLRALLGELMAITILPVADQNLQTTRDPIRENFNTINDIFTVDHVAYNASSNPGKHDAIHLVNQDLPPAAEAPATNATECSIYAALRKDISTGNPVPNTSTIYLKGPDSTSMLPGWDITTSSDLTLTDGWGPFTFNMLAQWGQQSKTCTTAQPLQTVTMARAFPNGIRSIQITPFNPGSGNKIFFNTNQDGLASDDRKQKFNVEFKGFSGQPINDAVLFYYWVVGY